MNGCKCRKQQLNEISWGWNDTAQDILEPLQSHTQYMHSAHTHKHKHLHIHNHFTALWILSGTTRLSRHQKKHSPTHTYRGHQSSHICFFHLLRSTASSLFNFTCLTVSFHNLSPSFLWFTSWPGTLHFILHKFLHPIIVFFLQHMPIPPQPLLL